MSTNRRNDIDRQLWCLGRTLSVAFMSGALAAMGACGAGEDSGDGSGGNGVGDSGPTGSGGATGGWSGSGGAATGGNAGSGGSAGSQSGCTTPADCPAIDTLPANCAEILCKQGECVYVARDQDGDGWPAQQCQTQTPGVIVESGSDCDDTSKDVSPSGWDGPAGEGLADGCDDGLDNDCNGIIDDGRLSDGSSCACSPGQTSPCAETPSGLPIDYPALGSNGKPLGECAFGSKTCLPNGTWGACTGAIGVKPETCDSNDADCDGVASAHDSDTPKHKFFCDEDSDDHLRLGAPSTEACSEPGTGCVGQWVRNPSPSQFDDCDDGNASSYPYAPELCDGKDNDCDGLTDEGNPGGGSSCDTGKLGPCKVGALTCKNGALVCEQNVFPATETCNGLDDDCDGTLDDGNPGGGATCDTGNQGQCAAGTRTCSSGQLGCVANLSPVPEVCDGKDNDCDGQVDEGNPGGGSSCDTGKLGPCKAGTVACSNGALSCVQNVFPSNESCNGVDDDCDGEIDESNPGGGGSCTVPGAKGICAASTWQCVGGTVKCQQTVFPTAEKCGNGLDDDCNGILDNGCPCATVRFFDNASSSSCTASGSGAHSTTYSSPGCQNIGDPVHDGAAQVTIQPTASCFAGARLRIHDYDNCSNSGAGYRDIDINCATQVQNVNLNCINWADKAASFQIFCTYPSTP
jgi:hypothetical protein